MCALFRQVRRAQVESFEDGQILRAERSEFIEQLFERFAAAFFSLSETVEGIERNGFAVFEDAFGTAIQSVRSPMTRCPTISKALQLSKPSFAATHRLGRPRRNVFNVDGVRDSRAMVSGRLNAVCMAF